MEISINLLEIFEMETIDIPSDTIDFEDKWDTRGINFIEFVSTLTYKDLLEKVDPENPNCMLLATLTIVFDMDPKLVHALSNYDHFWEPDYDVDQPCNHIQWLFNDTDERDPIDEMMYHLFMKYEPHYYEPYQYTDEEKQMIEDHKIRVVRNYGSIPAYLDAVSINLWKKKGYMVSEYNQFIPHNLPAYSS